MPRRQEAHACYPITNNEIQRWIERKVGGRNGGRCEAAEQANTKDNKWNLNGAFLYTITSHALKPIISSSNKWIFVYCLRGQHVVILLLLLLTIRVRTKSALETTRTVTIFPCSWICRWDSSWCSPGCEAGCSGSGNRSRSAVRGNTDENFELRGKVI